jgi:F-type H+-transporting ATPase subunit gamma
MAKTRELVRRRKAIGNIKKITRTMELIATARFKKAMDRAAEAEAYTRKIAELAADLSANAGDVRHPLLEVRSPIRAVRVLVLGSNRGLAGGYNASILRVANNRLKELQGVNVRLDLSGKRIIANFRYQRIPSDHQYTQFEDKPRFDEVDQIASRYISEYISGHIDRVDVVYTKFLNAARQVAVAETLLPLAPVSTQQKGSGTGRGSIEYEFLPDAASILEQLVPESFKVRLFKAFLDAAVSEQIARRVAMKQATEAAEEMGKELTREYNRMRQAQITKEIAEIVGGAEALK